VDWDLRRQRISKKKKVQSKDRKIQKKLNFNGETVGSPGPSQNWVSKKESPKKAEKKKGRYREGGGGGRLCLRHGSGAGALISVTYRWNNHWPEKGDENKSKPPQWGPRKK